ncbi:uncharacterized protein EI97DRAFT_188506 [Westerdykella ornata]|uniref:Uncharacterized protein n=1 Tax=Westerdykella ornata TaxID=318751 RepID=A0A6A6JAR6_WESOR|nr:uncharacterized protein EI97DRAFT_188506 [Westerdykella ornata]KAF2273068.1 hypothetical protein EI97DRAFT_188506 [Westerdykella ornata]
MGRSHVGRLGARSSWWCALSHSIHPRRSHRSGEIALPTFWYARPPILSPLSLSMALSRSRLLDALADSPGHRPWTYAWSISLDYTFRLPYRKAQHLAPHMYATLQRAASHTERSSILSHSNFGLEACQIFLVVAQQLQLNAIS